MNQLQEPKSYSIWKLSPNDANHQDDLVYEHAQDIKIPVGYDNPSYLVNCYLNNEISSDNHGIFGDAKYIEVRALRGHAIEKQTRVNCADKVFVFECNMKEEA